MSAGRSCGRTLLQRYVHLQMRFSLTSALTSEKCHVESCAINIPPSFIIARSYPRQALQHIQPVYKYPNQTNEAKHIQYSSNAAPLRCQQTMLETIQQQLVETKNREAQKREAAAKLKYEIEAASSRIAAGPGWTSDQEVICATFEPCLACPLVVNLALSLNNTLYPVVIRRITLHFTRCRR